jgi:hypothetical protein
MEGDPGTARVLGEGPGVKRKVDVFHLCHVLPNSFYSLGSALLGTW